MKLNIVGYSIYKTKEKKPDDLLLKIDSLEIESGHVNVIKSVSGLGKTTFLNAIAGQNQCAEGKIKLDGEEIVYNQSFFKDQCSYVTSDGCFLSDLTVLEQFSLVSKNQDDIDYLLNRFSMKLFLKKKISSLSRGEQKRVEVATAILKNCPLLILDEPTANLDKENSIAIFDAIEEYAINHIVIIASHESEIIKDSFEVYRIENQKLIINSPNDLFIKVDLNWTIEALINILKNAYEHTKINGEIKIDVLDNPIYTEINITDNGEGISKDDINHIFERFYKGENNKESIGIGLNMAKTIIEKENGIIEVTSEKNKYTTFKIKFYK